MQIIIISLILTYIYLHKMKYNQTTEDLEKEK